MDAAKVFSYGRDIGMIVDPEGTIVASTQGGEDALAYGSLGLPGAALNGLLDEVPRVPLFGNEGANVARLYRHIHIKTEAGRILTIHAITFPLGDSIEPRGGRFLVEQELHRAVADARGIGKPLGLLFDSIGAALWSFDVDGTILTWNRTSEAYFAHSRAGQFSPASVFLGVEDLNRIREAVNSGGFYHGNVALSARDGKARVNKVWVSRLVSEEDDPVGYACLSVDPEEHARAADLQKIVVQQPGDAILLVDRETAQVLDANLKVCDLLCCGRDDLVRKKVMDFIAEGRPTLGAEVLGALKSDGIVQMGRQLLKRKDGFLFPALVTLVPATLGQERYGLAFLVDLSSRVRIEDAVRKELGTKEPQQDAEKDELQKSLRLREEEAANLRKEAGEAHKREEGLTRMVMESRKREEALRHEMEDLKARPAPPPPEPPKPGIDVNGVLEEALAVFEEKAGHKVKVTKALKHVPPVDCLPELLKEVILTALGGIAEGAGKKGRVNIRTRQSRRGAVIEIVDRGGGIGPTVLARLFDPTMAESKSRLTAALVPPTGGKITFRMGRGKSALCRIELPGLS